MSTVREVSFELFREHGMTTMFGNPGSTELPMLAEFPDDFRYILGLQEAVVVGMADGYAQAAGQVTHVNLHTAPGVGNAMGALFNAQANHSPLLVTAGQQVRAQITMQANLTNRDATRVVHPYVKWSFEPPRAADVVAALAQGIHRASLPPKGPAFVSIPMDDWTQEVDDNDIRWVAERRTSGRAVADAKLTLEALLATVGEASDREAPTPVGDAPPVEETDPLGAGAVHATLHDTMPDDGIVVLESPTSTMALRNRLRISRPGSYYFCAGGGLGHGLSAGVGAQLAQPARRVACVLGAGSVQYAVSGFWTAVAYQIPITFLILRNNEYGILKWFAEFEQVSGAPGLDLPALETAEIARGYGVETQRVSGRDELRSALESAFATNGPSLVEVDV